MRQVKQHIFISAPMSAFADHREFVAFRKIVLVIVQTFEVQFSNSVLYYAGRNITTDHSFATPSEALESDLSALKRSNIFILLYPRPIVTSALIELGYALSLNIQILLVIKCRNDLPYMIRDIDKSSSKISILVVAEEFFINLSNAQQFTNKIIKSINAQDE